MIQEINEQIASIVKAINETETPVRKHAKNALTRLNNEIVLVQVRDSNSDYYKDLLTEKGNDY